MRRILVISPHPDDEAIGCGGTLRKHVVEGDIVHVIFLTSGEAGGHGRSPQETARMREREAEKAAAILGSARIEFWREPDGALRITQPVVNRLQNKLRQWQPEILYVTHDREMHADHCAAARLLRRALSGLKSFEVKPAALMFEVWTPLQRIDQVVDISPYVKTKMKAIRAYRSQCEVMRFDQAALGLNRYRGELHSGWPAAGYAEVFSELRHSPAKQLVRRQSPH